MNQPEKKPTVVIIGDWFLDENWLLDRQSLPHSSFVGERHYRAHHMEYNTRLIGFCGAPLLMQILHEHQQLLYADAYRLIGYGAWNPHDNDVLKCVLCPRHPTKKLFTPFTIASGRVDRSPASAVVSDKHGATPCRYGDGQEVCTYKPEIRNLITDPGARASTHRIIRGFDGTGQSEPHQLFRIDWQLDYVIPEDSFEGIPASLEDEDVRAIVIQDHGYGVITRACVNQLQKLRNGDKETPLWFVRTKLENPDWLRTLDLGKEHVDLVVTDFKLAEYRKGRRQWRHGPVLGRAALELLGELTGDVTYKHGILQEAESRKVSRAAVLIEGKDGNTAFAKHDDKCYDIRKAPYPRTAMNIGRTTVFYAALIAQRLHEMTCSSRAGDPSSEEVIPFGEQCVRALAATNAWTTAATTKWKKQDLCIYDGHKVAVDAIDSDKIAKGEPESQCYLDLWRDWNDSSKGLGLLQRPSLGPRKTLQMWRGEGALEGYICVGGPKRDEINELAAGIARYSKETSPKHPFNCLLIGRPGWGKTFLAKCLATHFAMEFLDFSLAQMCEHRDLIECLATISSVQNRTEKRVLVFMDEINAQIEGHSALGLLLDPLWSGTFIKDGRAFRLRPAVWIFASTSSIRDLASGGAGAKGLDFISRLNGPITSLDSGAGGEVAESITRIQGKLLDEKVSETLEIYRREVAQSGYYKHFLNCGDGALKTEQVYLMVSLLDMYWGQISMIEECVLQLFHDLLPINGFRSLEFLAGRFEGVRRGEVVAENVPDFSRSPELRRHVVVPEAWLKEKGRRGMGAGCDAPPEERKMVKVEPARSIGTS